MPKSLDLRQGAGLSVDLWVRFKDLAPGQVLLDSRDAKGRGFCLATAHAGAVRLELNDGRASAAWECDAGVLKRGKLHHVVAVVDARCRIITFVVDGVLCDGGEARPAGWGRYKTPLGDVRGSGRLLVAPSLRGQWKHLRLYGRYHRTSEAVGNYHAGTGKAAP